MNQSGTETARVQFDSMKDKGHAVFSLKIRSMWPNFDVDDMPEGWGDWRLEGEVLKVYKGQIVTGVITVTTKVYQGPVLARPAGFWVNEVPAVGQTWVLISFFDKKDATVAEIFERNLGFAYTWDNVKAFLP